MRHTAPHRLEIRALLFQETGWWIAQCLEHDIAVQARTREDLLERLERTLLGYLRLGFEKGRRPFDWIPPAPRRYWDLYEKANPGEPVEMDASSLPSALDLPDIELWARAA
jgi:predicted RNase H-like HicB family nuclease